MRVLSSLLACILFLFSSDPSSAVTLYVTDYSKRNVPTKFDFKPTCNVWLSGIIRTGDAQYVANELLKFARNPLRGSDAKPDATISWLSSEGVPGFYALCLSGLGGDIREALLIAEHFKGWAMVIEEDDVCESACAILFMKGGRRNGVTRFDERIPGRYLHVTAKLGFHSPVLDYTDKDRPVMPSEVSAGYERALQTMRDLAYAKPPKDVDPTDPPQGSWRDSENIVGTGERDGFMPRDLVLAILLTPPSQMFYVTTVEQALYWGIDLIGVPPPRLISSVMLRFGCINMVNLRCDAGGAFGACFRNRNQIRVPLTTNMSSIKDILMFESLYTHQFQQSRLWPPTLDRLSDIVVHGFRYADIDWFPGRNEAACWMRIAFQKNKLALIEVDTFNGTNLWRYLGPHDFPRLGDPMSGVEKQSMEYVLTNDPMISRRKYNPHGFRLWMMLPVSMRITDLVPSKDPWHELEQEGPYLDINVMERISSKSPKDVDTCEPTLAWDDQCPKKPAFKFKQ